MPALVYASNDEDSNMQGNTRPVGVRRFPQAVVDGHEASVQAVQLQESDDDDSDVPRLISSEDEEDDVSENEVDEEDEQTSEFWTPSASFLHCFPNGQHTFELYEGSEDDKQEHDLQWSVPGTQTNGHVCV